MEVKIKGPATYSIDDPSDKSSISYDVPENKEVTLTVGSANVRADITVGEPRDIEGSSSPEAEAPAEESPDAEAEDPEPAPTDGSDPAVEKGVLCFEVFPEQADDGSGPTGQYAWRFKDQGGAIRAVGGQGFSDADSAITEIHGFLDEVTSVEPHPEIVEVDE